MGVKVLLFRKNKGIISRCISLVTGSNITHSAILFEGQIWDSSERRGKFGAAKVKKLAKRKVEVYHLGASTEQAEAWLVRHNGKDYDYSGILQWFLFWIFGRFVNKLRLASKSKVYCFEATGALITRVTGLKFPKNVSGSDLRRVLGVKAEYVGSLKEYLNDAD